MLKYSASRPLGVSWAKRERLNAWLPPITRDTTAVDEKELDHVIDREVDVNQRRDPNDQADHHGALGIDDGGELLKADGAEEAHELRHENRERELRDGNFQLIVGELGGHGQHG